MFQVFCVRYIVLACTLWSVTSTRCACNGILHPLTFLHCQQVCILTGRTIGICASKRRERKLSVLQSRSKSPQSTNTKLEHLHTIKWCCIILLTWLLATPNQGWFSRFSLQPAFLNPLLVAEPLTMAVRANSRDKEEADKP